MVRRKLYKRGICGYRGVCMSWIMTWKRFVFILKEKKKRGKGKEMGVSVKELKGNWLKILRRVIDCYMVDLFMLGYFVKWEDIGWLF